MRRRDPRVRRESLLDGVPFSMVIEALTLERVEAMAQEEGGTVSAVLRRLIDVGLQHVRQV